MLVEKLTILKVIFKKKFKCKRLKSWLFSEDDLTYMYPPYIESPFDFPIHGGGCSEVMVMKQLVVKAAPFLFPCTIEYR